MIPAQRFFFLSILLLVSLFSNAQTGDSSEVKVPVILHYTTPATDVSGALSFYSLDTLLDDIEVFNPAIRNFYNDLGNIGSPSDPKLFSLPGNILTETGNHTFDLYKWSPSTVRYYRTNKRYSNLHYHMSAGKE